MFQTTICISCSKLFFFVCCWNRDPRSSFIHFTTTAASAKYLSTYLNYSLHAFLSPCKQEKSPNPQNMPPFVQKKNSSFTELSYQTAHPTSCISLRISNQNPKHAVFALQPRSHRAETFPGHPIHLCRHLQNPCMSRIITRRTDTCLIDTPPASALTVSAHVSRPAGGEHG